jgi:hypothetical protein
MQSSVAVGRGVHARLEGSAIARCNFGVTRFSIGPAGPAFENLVVFEGTSNVMHLELSSLSGL